MVVFFFCFLLTTTIATLTNQAFSQHLCVVGYTICILPLYFIQDYDLNQGRTKFFFFRDDATKSGRDDNIFEKYFS